jgi:hypothetical protein
MHDDDMATPPSKPACGQGRCPGAASLHSVDIISPASEKGRPRPSMVHPPTQAMRPLQRWGSWWASIVAVAQPPAHACSTLTCQQVCSWHVRRAVQLHACIQVPPPVVAHQAAGWSADSWGVPTHRPAGVPACRTRAQKMVGVGRACLPAHEMRGGCSWGSNGSTRCPWHASCAGVMQGGCNSRRGRMAAPGR